MRTRRLLAWFVAIGFTLAATVGYGAGAGAQGVASPRAQPGTGARVGDLALVVERAEERPELEVPGLPVFTPRGEFLLVWLGVTNTGTDPIEYDVCPPDGPVCFDQSWFEVVDRRGRAYQVDIVATSALEQAETVLPFGAPLPPGLPDRIVLVFDVPPDVASWSLTGTDQATAPFSLPLATVDRRESTPDAGVEVGMNEVVTIGDLELVATRAEVRPVIELPSFPEPFTPRGVFLVVHLTLTNAGTGRMEYDICPPGGPVCVNQTWFQVVDGAGRAYPVEEVVRAALDQSDQRLLPFGAELAPGKPGTIVLVFDVPPGGTEWWLRSTDEAPAPFSIRLALSAAPGSIQVVQGATGAETAAASGAIELILDTSGSMLLPLGDGLRIDVAKAVLTDLVTDTVPTGTPLALRVFGDTPGSCQTSLAVPLQPLDPREAARLIGRLQAADEVRTPIGAALDQVADDLRDVAGPKIVVLVTDGEETCGGDPKEAIRGLVAQGLDVRVNIVGFAVDDAALAAQFQQWARLGGGRYFAANDAAGLATALGRAVQAPFRVRSSDGETVATGVVGGDPVEVPAGRYRVEVETVPPLVFETVEVASGKRTELELEDQGQASAS